MEIVYAMTREVYPQILPSLRSLMEHNPGAQVIVLAEDAALPFPLPVNVRVLDVSGQKWFPQTGVNYNNRFKYINLLKVRYPTILEGLDKVIHLDTDTIVCGDLSGLWETDLAGKWFGAVREHEGKYKPFGDKYYNMGVAVINLSQMREDGIEQTMQDYLNTVKQPWADQDAWNKYGLEQGKITELSVRYNESPVTGMTNNPAIVHYCSIPDWFVNRNMVRVGYLDRYRT